jgi:hypothetical protein
MRYHYTTIKMTKVKEKNLMIQNTIKDKEQLDFSNTAIGNIDCKTVCILVLFCLYLSFLMKLNILTIQHNSTLDNQPNEMKTHGHTKFNMPIFRVAFA